MSIQFILGNSGSGKSTWLYDQVIRESGTHPRKKFLFLVPEQFTMQTQKEFVDRHPKHSILNIDVLSFQRLAYRVFDDLGMMDFVVLEETGKNLVLRKVAAQKENELEILGGNIRKTGYISELKSLLSELTQYHVALEDLEQVRSALEQKNALWHKLSDILTLYRGFEEFLKGRYVTADEIVSLLTKVAPESGMLRDSVVVLDGYTGFTPVQNEFLEELLPLAQSVQVALTMDDREPFYGRPDLQDLFYLSKKTIQSLYEIAQRQGVDRNATKMRRLYFICSRICSADTRLNIDASLADNHRKKTVSAYIVQIHRKKTRDRSVIAHLWQKIVKSASAACFSRKMSCIM